jgi:thymidine kinase
MTLILCHGGMYSGKSDTAISRVRSFSRSGLKRVLYQPKKNTRDIFQGKPVWFSRAGGDEMNLLPARFFESAEQVMQDMKEYDVFGFEEWQMYPSEIFEVINELNKSGKFVVAAGLDYYFNGEPVEIFDRLSKLDDSVLFPGVSALCQDCIESGMKTMAVRTQRTYLGDYQAFDAKKIIVDGSQGYDYKPVCFKHWRVGPPESPSLEEKYQKFYLEKVKTTLK